ncbi:MAG: sensor histidine kinase [Dysgonomonas sp.]
MQLLSSAPDEKRQEYISALSGKALRLERLIDDFYQISLLEAGQYPFYYGKVELCSLLTEILLDNYSTFSVNGIEPQIEIPDVNIYLNADRKACIRIIQNLIFNAITSTTSNVVVQLIYNTDSVQLCIKNPIATIPTEEYSKLLERFYVADISRSNGTSGQGLYIVKKLLLLMNCKNPIIEIQDHIFKITIDFSPLLIKKIICRTTAKEKKAVAEQKHFDMYPEFWTHIYKLGGHHGCFSVFYRRHPFCFCLDSFAIIVINIFINSNCKFFK